MKTKNSPRTILTIALVAALGGAGLVTTAGASPVASSADAAAFEVGAAERAAAKLPKAWRIEAKTVSFDSMYAR